MIQEALDAYQSYLSKQAVSAHTRRNYLLRVKRFLEWLEQTPDGSAALHDQIERDLQLREFKQYLLQRDASPNTINGLLSAVDNFYLSRGMEAGKVKRLELPRQAPRSLESEEERRLLKTLMRTGARNKALMMLLWHAGLRISELANLNISDVNLTARTGTVKVRCGKGLKMREVPINSELREALQPYLSKQVSRGNHEPLFLSQKKSRLSVASIDRIVRQMGLISGISLSAHDLRHHFVASLMRSGADIVIVAELTGHAKLETVRRYSLPTEQQKLAALEKLSHAG